MTFIKERQNRGEKPNVNSCIKPVHCCIYRVRDHLFYVHATYTVTLWEKKQFSSQAETRDRSHIQYMLSAGWCVKQLCAWRTDFLLVLGTRAACTHFQQHGWTESRHVTLQLNQLLIFCWSRVRLEVFWSVPTHCCFTGSVLALVQPSGANVLFGIRIVWWCHVACTFKKRNYSLICSSYFTYQFKKKAKKQQLVFNTEACLNRDTTVDAKRRTDDTERLTGWWGGNSSSRTI